MLSASEESIFQVVYEIVHRVIYKDISYEWFLNNINLQTDNKCWQDSFIETVNITAEELNYETSNELFQELSKFVNEMQKSGFISEPKLCLDLDPVLLKESFILQDPLEVFTKRVKVINTKLFFKQKKFNLICEGNFGYCTLISTLLSLFEKKESSKIFSKSLMRLIGKFNLDPNRVLLICFDLINSYNIDIKSTVGPFLHQNFAKSVILELVTYHISSIFVPEMFDIAISKLQDISRMKDIGEGIEDLVEKFKTLTESFSFDAINLLFEMIDQDYFTFDEVFNAIPLNLSHISKIIHVIEEIKRYKAKTYVKRSSLLLSSSPQANKLLLIKLCLKYLSQCNIKIYLLGLFIVTDYSRGMLIFSEFQSLIQNIAIKDNVSCTSLTNTFDCIHAAVVKHLATAIDADESLDSILGLVNQVKHLVGKNTKTFTKLIKFILDKVNKKLVNKAQLFKILECIVFPGMRFCKYMNCNLESMIFELVDCFEYSQRYSLYERILNKRYDSDANLLYQTTMIIKDTKQILKKVANSKEVMLMSGKKLKKLSQLDSLNCFQQLLENIQNYDNLCELMVTAIRPSSSLNFDVLSFLFVRNFDKISSSIKESKNSDYALLKLQALSKFIGFFYKKYYFVEINGLFNYVLLALQKGDINIVLLVEQICEKMGSQVILDNISRTSLYALNGSSLLRKLNRVAKTEETVTFISSGSTRIVSEIHYLKHALLSHPELALSLVIKLAQLRIRLVNSEQFNSYHDEVNSCSGSIDKVTQVFLQVSEFLTAELSMKEYEKIFKNFDEYALAHCLSPEIFFHFARRLIVNNFLELMEAEKAVDRKKINLLKNSKWYIQNTNLMNILFQLESSTYESKLLLAGSNKVNEPLLKLKLYFCSFSLYELRTPKEGYKVQVDKIFEQLNNKALAKRDIEKLKATKKQLEDDEKQQQELCHRVLKLFDEEKDTLFILTKEKNYNNLLKNMWNFMNTMLIPRSLLSNEGALYSFLFVMLVSNAVKQFNFNLVVECLPQLFYRIYCCTEIEAKNLSFLIAPILDRSNQILLTKKVFSVSNLTMADSKGKTVNCTSAKYDELIGITYSKFTKLIAEFLSSNSNNIVRAVLIISTEVIGHYPRTVTDATRLKVAVNSVLKKDNKQTAIMAKRYMALLEKRLRDGALVGVSGTSKVKKRKIPEISLVHESNSRAVIEIVEDNPKKRKSSSKDSTPSKKAKTGKDEKKQPIRNGKDHLRLSQPLEQNSGNSKVVKPAKRSAHSRSNNSTENQNDHYGRIGRRRQNNRVQRGHHRGRGRGQGARR